MMWECTFRDMAERALRDLWASGFLYGLVSGYSLEDCGKIGSACGYEVCQVLGASIPKDGWQRISNLLESMEVKW